MSTPVDLAHPPSSRHTADQELDLAALLELFSVDDAPAPSPRRALRSSSARLLGWALDSSRRAAAWGAVPASDVHHDRVALQAAQ